MSTSASQSPKLCTCLCRVSLHARGNLGKVLTDTYAVVAFRILAQPSLPDIVKVLSKPIALGTPASSGGVDDDRF
jgi:hypothetical protein